MAAEIDRLEINISANATDAESKVSALATSLEKLAGASGTSANGLYKDADGIAAIKDAAKNVGSVTEAIEKLTSSFSSISSIQPPKNLNQLAESFKPLKDISSSISGFANTRNVDRVMENISSIAMGLQSLSMMDASGIENIRNIFSEFEGFGVNPDVAKSLSTITSSIKRLSGIEFNDTLSDNLRLFIDTVHAITDDDAKRISDIANADRGLSKVMDETGNKEVSEPNTSSELDTSKVKLFSEEYWSLAKQGATDAISNIKDGIGEKIERIKSDVKELYEIAKGIGKFVNILGEIGASGVKSSVGWIMSPIKKVGSGFVNAAKKASEFLSSIKRIAMYRAIRTALKTISEGFQEGRENLYQYSLLVGTDFAKSMDTAATSFLYLKNSIGAATAPLTNYLVPILDRVVDQIVEVINKFNELTAVLTGADTWTKAIKYPTQWKEAADDATKAAKKLKSFMLGFDELNVIESTRSSGNSSAESGLDYSKMFEEVKVDVDLSEDTKSRIPSLFEPIMSAWDSEGMNTLNKIAMAWENIRGLVGSVRDAFVLAWENGTGQKTLETILKITGSIVGTFGNLARGIKKAWDNNGNGIAIMQKIWDIGNNVLTIFGNIWSDIEEWAATVDFEPAIKALDGLFEAFKNLLSPEGVVARTFRTFWNKILLPLGTWTIEEAVPTAVNTLASALDALGTALSDNESSLNSFIDFIKEIGSFTGDNIIALLTSLKILLDVSAGKEISEEDIAKLEKQQESQKKFTSSMEKIGYGWFDKFNPNAAKTGSWGEGDSSDKYLFGGDQKIDYEAGHVQHIMSLYDVDSITQSDYMDAIHALGSDATQEEIVQYIGGMRKFNAAQEEPVQTQWGDGWSEKDAGVDFAAAWSYGGGASFVKDWTDGLDTIQKKFGEFKSNWNSGFESIKKTASEKWSGFQSDWGSGIETIKQKWESFKTDWSSGWESIRQTTSEKWGSLKSDWSSGWESIKRGASETWENIKGGLRTFSDESGRKIFDFVETWKSGWREISKFVGEIVSKIAKSILGIWEGSDGKHGMKGVINLMLGGAESFMNFIVRGINALIERINTIKLDSPVMSVISAIADKVLPDSVSLDLKPISSFSLPRLATGGVVDTGQLFIARERGAELVGGYNNRTAVMNNDQIVYAVSDGVYRAVMSAMQNNGQGGSEIKVYLDGREITARTEEVKRGNGVSILGGVVYST